MEIKSKRITISYDDILKFKANTTEEQVTEKLRAQLARQIDNVIFYTSFEYINNQITKLEKKKPITKKGKIKKETALGALQVARFTMEHYINLKNMEK
ncbi:MAG: hypothetical protein J6W64_07170 [Bacilli bacterium]|nr:hypothetical protein [Bacilli bacterium]